MKTRAKKNIERSASQLFFAPAPFLKALRTIICLAMTAMGDHVPDSKLDWESRIQISSLDVARA